MLTLELPKDLEHELTEEAERRGLSLPDYALMVLATSFTTRKVPKTGTELVSYWQEEQLIGSRPDIQDSETYTRTLRQSAERRSLE